MATANIFAQVVNINPDPYDDPWIAGDAIPTPPEIEETVPFMVLTPESAATELPSVVDNSQLDYMTPVFHQKYSASCVQVAELWYAFAYEINRYRNVSGGEEIGDEDKNNQYHPFYSYNFYNKGIGSTYTSYKSGFQLIKESGCPNYEIYDDPAIEWTSPTKYKYWMNSQENYYSGMDNKIEGYENISWDDSYESLDALKHWLADHNAGDDNGGLAIISVLIDGWVTYYAFPPGTPEEYKHYVSQWGDSGGHALTIVGYHDDVQCFDIDGDGDYENADIDGDGIIQLDECEKGAFKVVNSYGIGFGDSGYIYVPYKLMASGLQVEKRAYKCDVQDEYESLLTVKPIVEYPARDELKFMVGYAENANQTQAVEKTQFKSFKYQGGSNDMRGAYEGPIEVGLDFWEKYSDEDFGKIFFSVDKKVNSTNEGTIDYFSIVDYRWGEEFELACDESNVSIINDDETILSVDYDLIVPGDNQEISQNVVLFSNMVSRFNPTVKNNSTLTIENGVEIDMYNSELIIEEGSTLIIEDNAIFTAKRGVSKIIVNGNIQVGTNVTFSADEESTIELHLKTPAEFTDCIFNNCIIESIADPLEISQCDFANSYIKQTISDIEISESDFSNSSIIASNPTMIPIQLENYASVTNCDFTTAFDGANSIIEIYGYKSYQVSGNIIDNISNPESTFHSISIDGSGTTESGYLHEISNNEVFCSYGFCDNDLSCITIYSSIANLQANYIHGNVIGLQSLGNSQIYVNGNQNATNETQTQRIKNNSRYQVYASREAFPLEMHWNAIYSSDNSQCYVYHDVDMSTNPPDVDVQRNYWGPNFDPDINLCPFRHYIYEPVWDLSSSQLVQTSAQQLFETGLDQIADSNYTDAKSTFQQVVTSYPNEEPARNSLKEILYLEPLAGNNFGGLKNWYLTEPVILNNEQLFRLAQNLANKCDEKLENYPDAIEWYESIIENPETLEDSIFAIIDLEHLYWQMGIDTNLRSISYVGRLGQFKPKSFKVFKDHKDELLSLLHGGQSNSTENEESEQVFNYFKRNGELLQNIPNPFNGTTRISYHLLYESDVKLNIYSYNGQLINTIFAGLKSEGTHSTILDASGFKSGIYFYSISINGQVTDIKKMTIVN